MDLVSNSEETVADNQLVASQRKMEKILGHLNPSDPPEVCPIRDILTVVTDKWSMLIVIMLGAHETLRFNELKKLVPGVSSKVLTERLKRMVRDGYLNREVYAEVPVRVEYGLSNFGIGYLNQLLSIIEWVDKEAPEVLKKRSEFDKVFKPSGRT